MHRFHEIPDAAVILASKGVFRQAKVFVRNKEIFAAHGSGFIRLYDRPLKGTSVSHIRWEDIDGVGETKGDQFGRLSQK